MRRIIWMAGLTCALVTLVAAPSTWAFPKYARETKAACATCHVSPAGGAQLTEAGTAFKADMTKKPTPVAGADYVGSAKCKMCHMPYFKAWQTTAHAHAFEGLEKAPDTTVAKMAAALKVEVAGKASASESCVGCHVTGYKLAGGYPAADSAKTVAVTSVTCESCHGPGAKHVAAAMADKKSMIYGHPTAKMCVQCHTPAMSPNFDFEAYKKKGVHAVPAKTSG